MNVWAVANQKGGVGKTTTAVSLGGLLARRGARVLLVDLDPHGSLSSYFGHDPELPDGSVYDLFMDGPSEAGSRQLVSKTAVEGLSLIPACTAMATLDRQLGTRQGKGLILQRALKGLTADYDHVLLDCPPMLGVLMVNALAACNMLLIPVQTEYLALRGLERMLRTVQMVLRSRPGDLPCHIVPTMFDRRTRACLDALEDLRKHHGECLWPGEIPLDTRFREASRQGQPLTVVHPWSRGSQAYRQLLGYLLEEHEDVAQGGGV